MKKVIAIIAVALASISIAHAQFGIVGGFTSSSTKINTEDWKANAKDISLYHVGLTYQLDLGLGFAIQPSLTYEMKGATAEEIIGQGSPAEAANTIETKSGYAELGLDLQWGPDLMAFRPFVFASPYLGYQITSDEINSWGASIGSIGSGDVNNTAVQDAATEAKNKLEYGFGVGVGVDVLDFLQIKAQYFMNLGNLYNEGKFDGNAAVAAFKNNYKSLENYNGIKVSLAILF